MSPSVLLILTAITIPHMEVLMVNADGSSLSSAPFQPSIINSSEYWALSTPPLQTTGYIIKKYSHNIWESVVPANTTDATPYHPLPDLENDQSISFTAQVSETGIITSYGDSHNAHTRMWKLGGQLKEVLLSNDVTQYEFQLCDQGLPCSDAVAGDGIYSFGFTVQQHLEQIPFTIIGDYNDAEPLFYTHNGWDLNSFSENKLSAQAGQYALIEFESDRGILHTTVTGTPLEVSTATHTLYGTVTFQGVPMEHVRILLLGTDKATTTDTTGFFQIPDLPAMGYILIADSDDYWSQNTIRHMRTDRTITISLQPKAFYSHQYIQSITVPDNKKVSTISVWESSDTCTDESPPFIAHCIPSEDAICTVPLSLNHGSCLMYSSLGYQPQSMFISAGEELTEQFSPFETSISNVQFSWQSESLHTTTGRFALVGNHTIYHLQPGETGFLNDQAAGLRVLYAELPTYMPIVKPVVINHEEHHIILKPQKTDEHFSHISGSLVTSDNQTPENLSIYIKTDTKFLYADYNQGYFTISDIPIGRWTLIVETSNYLKYYEQLSLIEGDLLGVYIYLESNAHYKTSNPEASQQGCSQTPSYWSTVLLFIVIAILTSRNRKRHNIKY